MGLVCDVKSFADFIGRPPDTATAKDVHRYQLRLASIGATVPTVNVSATALRFFFKVTLKRSDHADEVDEGHQGRKPDSVGGLLSDYRCRHTWNMI